MRVSSWKLRRSAALLAVVATLLIGVSIGFKSPIATSLRKAIAIAAPDPGVLPRPVFRYSVVPGGVYSAEELARSRRLDPIVAAHYADFASSGASIRNIDKDLWVYISYRKGNRVYWTTRKHRIPKGEAVLSDGKNLARARCGNRLSLTPRAPLLDVSPPTEQALNTPEAIPPPFPGAPPEFAPLLDGADLPLAAAQPIAAPFIAAGPARSGARAENPLGPAPYFPQSIFPFAAAPFLPGFFALPPGSGTGGTGSGGNGPGGGAGTPPGIGAAAVPEPLSSGLILIAAAVLISLRRARV